MSSQQFFKNITLLGAVELLLRLKSLVLMPLMTRWIGTVNYGVWSQTAVLSATFVPLILLGSESAVMRFLPGLPAATQARQFLGWVCSVVGFAAAVCGLLLLATHPLSTFFFRDDSALLRFIPLAVISLFVTLLLNLSRSWYRIHQRALGYSLLNIAQSLANFVAILAAVLRRCDTYQIVAVSIAADALVAVVFLSAILRQLGWLRPDFTILRPFLRFGLPLVPAGYAMWGINSMDRLFLARYTDLSQIGIYSFAYTMGYTLFQSFATPIWSMFPSAAAAAYQSDDRARVQLLFERSLLLLLGLALPAIAGLFALGRPIFAALSTPEFASGAPWAALVMAGYLCHIWASYYEVALSWVHRQYLGTVAIGAACGMNLLLNVLLIPRYGPLGAAAATAAAFAVQLLLVWLLARHYQPLVLRRGPIFKVALAAAAMGIAVSALRAIGPSTLSWTMAWIVAGALIYGLLLVCWRVVDLRAIKR